MRMKNKFFSLDFILKKIDSIKVINKKKIDIWYQ